MTWLGALNFILLQWFTLRLARVVQSRYVSVGARVTLEARSPQDEVVASARRIVSWTPTDVTLVAPKVSWRLMHGVVPLTGWWSPYRRLW